MALWDKTRIGLTFDDVVLVPAKSEVMPGDVDCATHVSRHITINIPILSAAMDTVTEGRLAIALAREGGIGVLHRAMSPENQAREVDKVKKSESGMIMDPITISPDQTIRDAHEIMATYRISGIPVTREKKLVGILTNRDLRFESRLDLPVSQVMTQERLVTVPEGTSLTKAREILHEHRIEKLPVVNDAFELKGLITIKDIQKQIKYPNACKDTHGRLRVAAAVGVGEDVPERVERLVKAGVDMLVVDTAHGHSQSVIDTVKMIKQQLCVHGGGSRKHRDGGRRQGTRERGCRRGEGGRGAGLDLYDADRLGSRGSPTDRHCRLCRSPERNRRSGTGRWRHQIFG